MATYAVAGAVVVPAVAQDGVVLVVHSLEVATTRPMDIDSSPLKVQMVSLGSRSKNLLPPTSVPQLHL